MIWTLKRNDANEVTKKQRQTHRCREQTCCQGVGVAEGRIGSLGLTEIEYYT